MQSATAWRVEASQSRASLLKRQARIPPILYLIQSWVLCASRCMSWSRSRRQAAEAGTCGRLRSWCSGQAAEGAGTCGRLGAWPGSRSWPRYSGRACGCETGRATAWARRLVVRLAEARTPRQGSGSWASSLGCRPSSALRLGPVPDRRSPRSSQRSPGLEPPPCPRTPPTELHAALAEPARRVSLAPQGGARRPSGLEGQASGPEPPPTAAFLGPARSVPPGAPPPERRSTVPPASQLAGALYLPAAAAWPFAGRSWPAGARSAA